MSGRPPSPNLQEYDRGTTLPLLVCAVLAVGAHAGILCAWRYQPPSPALLQLGGDSLEVALVESAAGALEPPPTPLPTPLAPETPDNPPPPPPAKSEPAPVPQPPEPAPHPSPDPAHPPHPCHPEDGSADYAEDALHLRRRKNSGRKTTGGERLVQGFGVGLCGRPPGKNAGRTGVPHPPSINLPPRVARGGRAGCCAAENHGQRSRTPHSGNARKQQRVSPSGPGCLGRRMALSRQQRF